MRMLFVFKDVSKQSGVFNKVKSHINGLQRNHKTLDIEVLVFGNAVHLSQYDDFSCNVKSMKIPKYKSNALFRKPLFWGALYERELGNIYSHLLPAITDFNPEIVLMRDFAMSQSGVQFLKHLSKHTKVVLESNTRIDSELKLKAEQNEWSKIEFKKEIRSRKRILKYVSGIIAVTSELASQYYQLGLEKSRVHVFSNGIDVMDLELDGFPKGNEIKGVFLAGTGSNWNGIERLIESLRQYSGRQLLQIDVIGISGNDIDFDNNAKLKFRSTMSLVEINNEMSKYHFGISTLALYKKGMIEASALKVRTYLAHGLPVLLAYDDTDIKGKWPFIYRVSNDDRAIPFDHMLSQFEDIWRNDAKGETYLFAKQNLDFKPKQKKLVSFLNELVK